MTPAAVYVEQAGVWVRVQRHPRAKYVSLRIDARGGHAVLVLPRRATVAEGKQFAEYKAEWLQRHLANLPPRVPFASGVSLPYLGIPHRVHNDAEAAGAVRREGGYIVVPGARERVPDSLRSWFKSEARREIVPRVQSTVARLGRRVSRIVLTDPRTRWGSCSAKGSIAFSWRLILAPERVLDYVVAHEVAHLEELSHNRRFWRIVERLCPHVETSEEWLRSHGHTLHRYG